jgi:Ca2+-binding RTX toxin-like protein
MTGGAGDDTITGGAGANTLVGGCGSDKVNGAAGDDFVYGDGASACSGSDRVKGGAGNDVVQGNHGDDRVDGGSGKDRIEGDGSVGGCIGTSCFAIGGADTIVSRDGKKDTVKCGPGADTLKADKKDKVAKDCETVKRKVAKVAEAR